MHHVRFCKFHWHEIVFTIRARLWDIRKIKNINICITNYDNLVIIIIEYNRVKI